ncbi:MAG: ribonuclease H-like domain-containing protein [Balneolales bacterium]|nr:ribonuclease H-like domain-containing protein [Balneolales bacterium]
MFFVFDIESIPDFNFIRTVLGSQETDEDALLERASEELARNKSGFLPPMFHQMVSWVGLWIDNTGEPRNKVSWNGTDEKEGLKQLIHTLSAYKDFGLIHHNGKGFDLPLIHYRSLKHGLQLPRRLSHHDIRYRFSQHNVDLVDEFSNYGASSWPKLKHLGLLIGIPFKQMGEGNEVLSMFRDNKLDEIEHYCYEDVIATYLIWLYLKHNTGEMNDLQFTQLRDRAMAKLQEIQNGLPG